MRRRATMVLVIGAALALAAVVHVDGDKTQGQAQAQERSGAQQRAVVRDWPLVDATGRSPRSGTCGNRSRRVLLTFDDWDYAKPSRMVGTARLARRLGVGMMYFPLGQPNRSTWGATGRNLAMEVRRQGQMVGNHTASHPSLPRLSNARVRAQIRGGVHSTLLRPPYGEYDARVRTLARREGYRICLWTLDTRDWEGLSPRRVRTRIVRHVHPGDVVLLHLNHALHRPYDVRALIRAVRSTGLKLCRPWRTKGKVTRSPTRLPARLPC